MEKLFLVLILFPLAGAIAVFLADKKACLDSRTKNFWQMLRDLFVILTGAGTLAAMGILAVYGEGSELFVPEICGMGISFCLDGFRMVYGLVAAFMWMMTLLFSREYLSHETDQRTNAGKIEPLFFFTCRSSRQQLRHPQRSEGIVQKKQSHQKHHAADNRHRKVRFRGFARSFCFLLHNPDIRSERHHFKKEKRRIKICRQKYAQRSRKRHKLKEIITPQMRFMRQIFPGKRSCCRLLRHVKKKSGSILPAFVRWSGSGRKRVRFRCISGCRKPIRLRLPRRLPCFREF